MQSDFTSVLSSAKYILPQQEVSTTDVIRLVQGVGEHSPGNIYFGGIVDDEHKGMGSICAQIFTSPLKYSKQEKTFPVETEVLI